MSFSVLADAVLVLHVAIVLFVVGGLLLVVGGNVAGWRWVNHWWLRLLHLGPSLSWWARPGWASPAR